MKIYIAIMRTPPTLTEGFNGFTNYVLHCDRISIIEKEHEPLFMELLNTYYCSKAMKDDEGMFNANRRLDKLEYAVIRGNKGKANSVQYCWAEFFRNWKINASTASLEQPNIFLKKDHFQVVERQLVKSL